MLGINNGDPISSKFCWEGEDLEVVDLLESQGIEIVPSVELRFLFNND